MRTAVTAFVLTLLLLGSRRVAADENGATAEHKPPTISRVFPPGGQRGTRVDVRLTGSPGTPAGVFWTDRGQLSLTLAEDGKSAVVHIPPDASGGLHWLRCHNRAGAGPRVPFVVGVIEEVSETEPNDRVASAMKLDNSATTVNGTLGKSGDVDVYGLSLTAGQTVVCSLTASQVLNSPVDAVLQIVDASGTVLSHNDDDHQLDPELVFTAATTGEYFVRVFGFPSSPNSTIRLAGASTYVYRLTTTTEAFVDHVRPPAVDGSVESRVRLSGWNIPEHLQTVVVSPLRPKSFAIEDVTVPVEIGRSSLPSFAEAEIDDAPGPLSVPLSVSGVISQSGEEDEFSFRAQKGDKLEFLVAAFAQHSSLDAVLTLLNESGKVLKTADDIARDNFDARLAVTISEDGTYRVRIADRYQAGSARHFYRLTIRPLLPSVTATVAADAFVLPRDKPLEIPVTMTRSNGHASPVTMAVVGLPKGVLCEPVVSEPKGDSAKKVVLKLSVAADELAGGFQGVVQITAPQQDVKATVTLPAGNGRTGDLWLTVPAR
ncbi:MAG: PPC domain-containing protein [Planctomycetaceae bacterium]|nr:PPC domain-containing protein [Planctomycetaceae bacterium]